MQASDRAAFGALLAALAEVFSEALSETRVEAYFRALQDLPLPEVRVAVEHSIRGARWFPKPIELREALTDSVEDRASGGWLALIAESQRGYWHSPTFEDGLIVAVIEAVFGGWPQAVDAFCDLTEPAWQAKRKEFLAAYQTLARREWSTKPRAIMGMFARQDALSGWTSARQRALEAGTATGPQKVAKR